MTPAEQPGPASSFLPQRSSSLLPAILVHQSVTASCHPEKNHHEHLPRIIPFTRHFSWTKTPAKISPVTSKYRLATRASPIPSASQECTLPPMAGWFLARAHPGVLPVAASCGLHRVHLPQVCEVALREDRRLSASLALSATARQQRAKLGRREMC